MDNSTTTLRALPSWLALAVAGYFLGVGLSGFAATFGITDFPNDHRGEWGLLTFPILVAISCLLGFFSLRSLLRHRYSAWAVALVGGSLVLVTLHWGS